MQVNVSRDRINGYDTCGLKALWQDAINSTTSPNLEEGHAAMRHSGAPLNVLILAPSLIPSVIIGVMRPLVSLEKQGRVRLRLRLMRGQLFRTKDLRWCDVAVFCRNCEIHDLETLYELKQLGKKVIYEIDDNFQELPLTTNLGMYHRAPHRQHVLRRFYQLSDLVRVYSPIIADQARAYGSEVHRSQLYFDVDLSQETAPSMPASQVVRIAYPTGRIDEPGLENIFFAVLREVLVDYGGKIELHLWRRKLPKQLVGLTNVVLNRPLVSYESFIQSFCRLQFDIGLAPIIDTVFYRSKTNNKYRELGGCGVAGVYSDVMPYRDSVENGVTGLLVENTKQAWSGAIRSLIDNLDLRSAIGTNARRDIEDNYTFAKAVDDWSECLLRAIGSSRVDPFSLPTKDRRLIGTFIYFADDDDAFVEKAKIFARAINQLGGSVAAVMDLAVLETWPLDPQSGAYVAVCKADGSKEFEELRFIFERFGHVILDLSDFREDKAAFLTLLDAPDLPSSVSFLLASDRCDLQVSAQARGLTFATFSRSTSINVRFSLRSYNAALLDLLDRRAAYDPTESLGSILEAALRMKNRLANRAALNVGRCKRAWRLIQWRAGLRPM